MNTSNWTGRAPRTLEQAFGPHTNTSILDRAEDMQAHRRLARIAGLSSLLAVLLIIWGLS